MTKILINQGECIGCAFCENCMPEIFKLDESDFKAKIIIDEELKNSGSMELNQEQIEKLKEVASDCPVKAIKIE